MESAEPSPGGIYSLLEAWDGPVWAGTWGQLWNWRDGSWKRYDSTNGLPKSELRSLVEGSDGTLWVGAREGLFNFKDGLARQLTNSSSWAQASVGGLLVDREGTVWIGTSASFRALVWLAAENGLGAPFRHNSKPNQTHNALAAPCAGKKAYFEKQAAQPEK